MSVEHEVASSGRGLTAAGIDWASDEHVVAVVDDIGW